MTNLRGIFPGAFTMGNMLCGFLAILSAQGQNPAAAGWFIILAAFLDALDGKVARLSRGTSRFGKELDSLADIVSFGVAPAILVHSAKLHIFGKWSFMVGAIFLMAGAFRLARYNVMADPHRKDNFSGLPIPIAAIAIASYTIASLDLFDDICFPQFMLVMVLGCSALMVSQITYDSLPEKFDRKENRWRMVVIFIFLVAVLVSPKLAIFPFVAGYILYGFGRSMHRTLFGRRIGKDEEDDSNPEGDLSYPTETGSSGPPGSDDQEGSGESGI